ncbi:MAG: DUF3858 domain-containing protein, partial [Oceanihabitans sp.]
KAKLEETAHPLDPDASAAVLYRNYKVNYEISSGKGFVQVVKVFERIKIYDQEGYEVATKKIKYYDKSSTSQEEIKGLKGYTYNLENNKIEKTKLKSENIFEEKNNKYWSTTKFTMPNIKEGSVIEFQYSIESPFMAVGDINIQYNIPIKKLDIDMRIPEYFVFNKVLNPKASFYPEINETTVNRKEDFSGLGGTETIEFIEKKTSINIENVPALKKEPLVNNLNNYRSKLIMEYAAFKAPNGIDKYYSTNWEKVTKTIYDSENFGGQLKKSNYFKDEVSQLIKGVSNPLEKTELIYNFVKSKVKWNSFIGYSSENGVKKAFSNGSGNVADINLMLTAMLKFAGLNANPVLISTKSNGIPIIPTTSGFNYVVAAVELPTGMLLLDAASTYASANVLPKFLLNWQGRIIKENGTSSWVSLQAKQSSKQTTFLNATINEDLSIVGKVREQQTNHFALSHRQKFNDLKVEELLSALEEDKGDIEVSNVEVKFKDQLNKPILISYEYNLQNGMEEIADKLYLPTLLFFSPEENPFKQEVREYPIDFSHPLSEKYVVNIKIPEGYQVESLPENAKVQLNVSDGQFTYLINQNNNILQITASLDINKVIILPKDYAQFKAFFDLVIKKQTEQIVLKKA